MTLKTLYQNAMHYKERENPFIKNYKGDKFSPVFVVTVWERMSGVFSLGLLKKTAILNL